MRIILKAAGEMKPGHKYTSRRRKGFKYVYKYGNDPQGGTGEEGIARRI